MCVCVFFMRLSYQGTDHFYFAPTKNGSDLRPFIKLSPNRKRLIKLQNIMFVNSHLISIGRFKVDILNYKIKIKLWHFLDHIFLIKRSPVS